MFRSPVDAGRRLRDPARALLVLTVVVLLGSASVIAGVGTVAAQSPVHGDGLESPPLTDGPNGPGGDSWQTLDSGDTGPLLDSGGTESVLGSDGSESLFGSGDTESLLDSGGTESVLGSDGSESLLDSGDQKVSEGAESDPVPNDSGGNQEGDVPDNDTGSSEDATRPVIDPALEHVTGEVTFLVGFETGVPAATEEQDIVSRLEAEANDAQAPLRSYAAETDHVTVERGFWITNAALVTVDTDHEPLERLLEVEGVHEISPAGSVEFSSAELAGDTSDGAEADKRTNETALPETYADGLEQIRVPAAWESFRTRGEGVTVAVLDSGVDATHPAIDVDGWKDFSADPSPEPTSYHPHGTHVTGILVGGAESGEQIGVAPDVRLLHGAVMTDCDDDGCSAPEANLLDGIEWAVENDADVVSMSIGWTGYNERAIDAVTNANAAGTVVVGAVGNAGEGKSASPANIYGAISVGAADRTDRVPSFSGGETIDTAEAWGNDPPKHWPESYVVPDVVAPGVGVTTTAPGGEYDTRQGTSMATPHVSGTVALVQAATRADLEPDELRTAVTETAWKPSDAPETKDERYGFGIVDAYTAIEAAGTHAHLEGTVTDEVTGAPLEDAVVRVADDDGETIPTRTNESGGYSITGLWSEQPYAVTVEKAGYGTFEERVPLAANEERTMPISLAGSGTIAVAVADEHFDTGIEGATVTAVGENGSYPGIETEPGQYTVDAVPSGATYDLVVDATGYEAVESVLRVDAADPHRSESVVLSGDAAVSITVVDDEGAPVENASVAVVRGERTAEPKRTTDANGIVTMPVPGTGDRYAVAVTASGFEPNTTETDPVESGAVESVSVTLSRAAAIPVPGFGVVAGLVGVLATVVTAIFVARCDR